MRTRKRGLEVVVEEGGEAWKEGDPWPPVQSDSEEDEDAEEEAEPSCHICKLTPKPSWKVLPELIKWNQIKIKQRDNNHFDYHHLGWPLTGGAMLLL
jgi:hypothetical protein